MRLIHESYRTTRGRALAIGVDEHTGIFHLLQRNRAPRDTSGHAHPGSAVPNLIVVDGAHEGIRNAHGNIEVRDLVLVRFNR